MSHWPARDRLTFQFLKDLYYRNPSSLANFNEDCQFLPFKSSFSTLEEFFEMPAEQVHGGQPTWYVGFSNCQANILSDLRALYPRPHFLPADAEIPNTDYTFLGYSEGAVMHVSFFQQKNEIVLTLKKSEIVQFLCLFDLFCTARLHTTIDVASSIKRQ